MKIRNVLLLLCGLSLGLGGGPAAAAPAGPPDAFALNKRLGRGVNILGYDPIWRSRDQARFKTEYFAKLKAAGFDSVRINLHAFRHMERTNHWALRPAWFTTLDWAVAEAQRQGLAVILDLHEFQALGKDAAANRAPFLAFWRQMAAHYQNAPATLYFEVLNEPSQQLTPALWNEYFAEALAIIRATHPTRGVVVGPAHWNAVGYLDQLQLPETDRHLIVTVHFYAPFEFTHQGASWANRQDKVGVTWNGTADEKAAIDRVFDQAQAWAGRHQRPLLLGEFGAYDRGDMDSRVRWTAAVARAAEARGWSWAYWQFDSDFILYDVKREAWVEPILHALIPKTP
ncbi:MAG TPA: cellulase family glycosylhydrolase [Verrucomicrobiota bacterium]|nr:cellulase family glycosylhydrolase [Verrucomicrobiota bacterium]HNT14060.1 cellulase family glycosylhydrolase [Verrucomicrobiota bacterium]